MIAWWITALMGCPKVGSAPAIDELRPAEWVQVEVGKDLCMSSFPGTPFDKRTERRLYIEALQAIRAEERANGRALLGQLPAEHPTVRSAIAVLDLMEGEVAGSSATLGSLAEAHPTDPCLSSSAALALWASGDQQRAVELLQQARRRDPLEPRVAFLAWYLEVERPDTLVAALDVGLKSLPEHVGIQLARGSVALAQRNVELAVPLLEAALAGGAAEAEGPLLQAYFVAGLRSDYLRFASALKLPMGDKGAVALAEDPDAAYSELLGLAEGQTLRAVFQTSQGDLTCVLRHDLAPVTVANFVALAEGSMPWMHPETGPTQEPLYDGTVFHRVIPEFMVQGGDPVGTGSGGPGYRFLDEIHRQLRFDQPGRLAMANQGPHTNGSQFFVTEVPTPHLDGRHTIFGECDETSVEVVKRMTRVPSEESRPVEPLLLERVEIQRQP